MKKKYKKKINNSLRVNEFSFTKYKKFLKFYSKRITNFSNALHKKKFVLLRHDIEFSISRALEIAKVEYELKVKSTFFFQVISQAYNPFSIENIKKIQKIKEMGHEIGLHLYISDLDKPDKAKLLRELKRQKLLFEKGFKMKCIVFSFHRPKTWILKLRNNKIGGLINAYGKSFFEFSPTPKKIIYLSDSNIKWKYGDPLDHISSKKVQILIHPDHWWLNGSKNIKNNFLKLEKEHHMEFKETLDNEMSNYSTVMNLKK